MEEIAKEEIFFEQTGKPNEQVNLCNIYQRVYPSISVMLKNVGHGQRVNSVRFLIVDTEKTRALKVCETIRIPLVRKTSVSRSTVINSQIAHLRESIVHPVHSGSSNALFSLTTKDWYIPDLVNRVQRRETFINKMMKENQHLGGNLKMTQQSNKTQSHDLRESPHKWTLLGVLLLLFGSVTPTKAEPGFLCGPHKCRITAELAAFCNRDGQEKICDGCDRYFLGGFDTALETVPPECEVHRYFSQELSVREQELWDKIKALELVNASQIHTVLKWKESQKEKEELRKELKAREAREAALVIATSMLASAIGICVTIILVQCCCRDKEWRGKSTNLWTKEEITENFMNCNGRMMANGKNGI